MSWKQALRKRDETDNYVVDRLLPDLILAAVENQSSNALQLLGSTMLMSCLKWPQKVHPLATLFDPKIMFLEVFSANGRLESHESFWASHDKQRLLDEIAELLFDARLGYLLRITHIISRGEACRCSKHAKEGNASAKLCQIPAVQLWEQIGLLSMACQQKPVDGQQILNQLEGVTRLLMPDWELAQFDWWPSESRPFQNWSRYRAVFMLSLAHSMLTTAAPCSKNGIKDSGPAPITSADLNAAEQAMKECWKANEKLFMNVGNSSQEPKRTDFGDLNSRLDALVELIERANGNLGQAGKWQKCRSELKKWTTEDSADLSVLERIVFGAILDDLSTAIDGH